MIIYPAIDLSDGKCVRLYQGDMGKKKTYSSSPPDVAKMWAEMGAEWIHVVDLDGAVAGSPVNLDAVIKIIESVDIKIQMGGGIRDLKTMQKLVDSGVSRAIVGTKAVEDETFVKEALERFGDRLGISIDAKGDRIATAGWLETSDVTPETVGKKFKNYGAKTFVYTQILRDGTLEGPDLERLKKVASAIGGGVIASGGVGSLSDVENILELAAHGIDGIIIGKALYENKVNLSQVIKLARDNSKA